MAASPHPRFGYRIVRSAEWEHMCESGQFTGSSIDSRDGFIHMSTSDTVKETARRYFAAADDAELLKIDLSALGDNIKWEAVASRDGAEFPHLYNVPLPRSAVCACMHLRWVPDANDFEFPAEWDSEE